jgi:hypothetical protein
MLKAAVTDIRCTPNAAGVFKYSWKEPGSKGGCPRYDRVAGGRRLTRIFALRSGTQGRRIFRFYWWIAKVLSAALLGGSICGIAQGTSGYGLMALPKTMYT